MSRLEGRIAIVTGAGQGIGEGIARRYAAEGASIVVAEINEAAGRQTADAINKDGGVARFVRADVGEKASVQAMVDFTVDAFGRVDVLVNNAQGLTMLGRLEHKTDEQFAHSFGTGVYATLWAMQAVFPLMRDAGGGRIINLASLNGINAHKYSVDYNATKEAIRALSRTAAAEWGRHNILVNVIAPGALTPAARTFNEANPDVAAAIAKMIPLGHLGDPETEIVPVAVFLAADDSRYMTGNTLFVDGGGHINGVPWDPDLPEEPLGGT